MKSRSKTWDKYVVFALSDRWAIASELNWIDLILADKAVYGDQSLGDRIDRNEKTFESDSAEQRRSIRSDKARRGDFIAIERQFRFRNRPDLTLSSGNHHALRTGGLQGEFVGEGLRHNAECRTGIDKKLDFLDMSVRNGQTSFYVEDSHVTSFFENVSILAQSVANATAPMRQQMGTQSREQ